MELVKRTESALSQVSVCNTGDMQQSTPVSALLPTQPEPLTAADAEDFVACALHYAFNTPYSVRQRDLQSHLFATNSAQVCAIQ